MTQSFQKAGLSTQPTENLSQREQEVLDCLSQGFLYKEIAEKLGISYETVHTYIRRIYEKPAVLPPRPRQEPDGWLLRGIAEGRVERLLGPYVVAGAWWQREVRRDGDERGAAFARGARESHGLGTFGVRAGEHE